MNDALQDEFDAVLAREPSMTFFEAQTELLQRGTLDYQRVQDPAVHAKLFRHYQRAKDRANQGRYNQNM